MAVKKRPSKPVRVSPRAGKTPRKKIARPQVSAPRAELVPAFSAESPARARSLSGWVVILILAVLAAFVISALAFRQHAENTAAPAPVAVAPSPVQAVPTAVPNPAPEQPTRHTAARTGEGSGADLSLSLRSGKPLSLRCWASAANPARLDIFSPRNLLVYSTLSAPGAKGWQKLSWDGKDAQGAWVQPGTYYVRPSQKGDQIVLELKVKK